jgi:lipid-A-disaccharide synthase
MRHPNAPRAREISGPEAARRVFISVGERSGDIVGAQLITALRRHDSAVHVFGLGGARMAEAGADIGIVTNDLGVVGVTEAVGTIPTALRVFASARRTVRTTRPDVAVLIGNDIFNTVLARWLKRRGVPTLAYFPPQVWIWRAFAKPIARGFDAIFASFPDEYEVYSRAAATTVVTHVGQYLAATLRAATDADRDAARTALGLRPNGSVIALLPGSRRQELNSLGSVLAGAAQVLAGCDPDVQFVVPVVDDSAWEAVQETFGPRSSAARTVLCRDSHLAMQSADLAVVASGTASLEAALIGVPMIVVYKVSRPTELIVRAAIALRLIESFTVGLPNLITKQRIVRELLQRDATAESIAREAAQLLADPARRTRMKLQYAAMADTLRADNPVADVAAAVLRWADAGRLTSSEHPASVPAPANRRIPARETD